MSFFIIDDHSDCYWDDFGRDRDKVPILLNQFMDMLDKLNGNEVSMFDWKPYTFGMYGSLGAVFAITLQFKRKELQNYRKITR